MRLPHPNAQRRGGSPERHASYLLAAAAALVLAGCADLSGLGASSTFKCNAPPGLTVPTYSPAKRQCRTVLY